MKIKNKEELIQMIQAILEFLTKEESPISHFEYKKSLLMSKDWPEAVPAFLICSENEEDKFERVEGIIDLINIEHSINFSNKKILDFGCGEGHLVKKIAQSGNNIIGYDIKKQGNLEWNESENPCATGDITTNWQKILSQKPFDLIILYDVIDHCEDPIATLNSIYEVCNNETNVFLRTHPFCGPHGGHIYQQINKAYIHLFFNEDELKEMNVKSDFVQKIFFPLDTMNDWLKKSNFKITNTSMNRIEVSPFFRNQQMIDLLLENYPTEQFPEWQMSQIFNDYIIQKIPK